MIATPKVTADIDLAGLTKFNSQLFGALLGTGQGGEGDVHRFIKSEAGQLAWDISNAIGPKTKNKGIAAIARDVRKVFFGITVPVFPRPQQGQGDIQWLFASSKMNYLVGAHREDVLPGIGQSAMKEAMKSASRERGPSWKDTGVNRGKQHVILISRIVTAPAKLAALVKEQSRKVGQLRASFAYTASKLVPGKRIPGWVSAHFSTKANGRAIYNEARLAGPNPVIEFGSTAKGVNSNPYLVQKIYGAVERRKEIVKAKINKIVKGYTYNWNTGQVFKEQVPKGGLLD